ncbi:hypothetical protein QAD02_012733 [Eretmocerus hayati]|uniref:Uncharacterized protein n=1 Tax=Eretmocerus hayati TaxID=131215 RepID=A0ACC2P297_9HYME|nr:hypothetical protein QAD02_012733 [Eretmocerus hayati]
MSRKRALNSTTPHWYSCLSRTWRRCRWRLLSAAATISSNFEKRSSAVSFNVSQPRTHWGEWERERARHEGSLVLTRPHGGKPEAPGSEREKSARPDDATPRQLTLSHAVELEAMLVINPCTRDQRSLRHQMPQYLFTRASQSRTAVSEREQSRLGSVT